MKNYRKFSTILVPLDGSKNADKALDTAISISKKNQAKLILFHVIDDYILDSMTDIEGMEIPNSTTVKVKAGLKKKAMKMLNERSNKALKNKIDCKTEIHIGNIGDEILSYSEQNKVDLIIMGARGLGKLKQLLLGSVSNKIVTNSHCPVMIVK